MIIKFHSRGRGCGSGSVDYLLGKDRDRDGARLDAGNPEQMIELIDSIKYTQKYKSGVLSFAERDLPEEQKQEIMQSFEQTLMPGLEKDQYSILWVQHQDKDRLELNFVVANVELQSGKRLQPYYDPVDRPRMNAWKDLVNDRFQLHDPNDPSNKRTLCTPNDLPRAKKDASEAITRGLMGLVGQGVLKSRSDVLNALQRAGFEIARTTPTAISIKNPQGGQNLRLKGSIYEQSFGFSKELRADIERASENYRADRSNRVQESRETLNRLTELKRAGNQKRYPRAEQAITADYVKNLERDSHSDNHNFASSRANTGMAGQNYQQEPRHNRTAERNNSGFIGQRWQDKDGELYRRQESQKIMYSSEQDGRDLEQWQSDDSNGVLGDDRFRKALAKSTGTDADRTEGTAGRFTADVREYKTGQSSLAREFENLCRATEHGRTTEDRTLTNLDTACKQLDRASTELRTASQTVEEVIQAERGGWSR